MSMNYQSQCSVMAGFFQPGIQILSLRPKINKNTLSHFSGEIVTLGITVGRQTQINSGDGFAAANHDVSEEIFV